MCILIIILLHYIIILSRHRSLTSPPPNADGPCERERAPSSVLLQHRSCSRSAMPHAYRAENSENAQPQWPRYATTRRRLRAPGRHRRSLRRRLRLPPPRRSSSSTNGRRHPRSTSAVTARAGAPARGTPWDARIGDWRSTASIVLLPTVVEPPLLPLKVGQPIAIGRVSSYNVQEHTRVCRRGARQFFSWA